MTMKQAKEIGRQYGFAIRKTIDREIRVSIGNEQSAYYTDDIIDAVDTGRIMAKTKSINPIMVEYWNIKDGNK